VTVNNMVEKWCGIGGVPMTCGHMIYPAGTGPFGCAFEGYCDYQRPHDTRQSKPTSPPEMPEVDRCKECGKPRDDSKHVKYGPDEDNPVKHGFVTLSTCPRFAMKIGKKEANSCVGCTVGCPGKGKQEPEKAQPDGPPIYSEDNLMS